MLDEIDLNFLGEQIKRLRADVRELKARTARTDADVLALSERLDTLERRVHGGFEAVDHRFEGVDRRFDHLSEHLHRHDREFAVLRAELAEMRAEMTRNLEIVLTAIRGAKE